MTMQYGPVPVASGYAGTGRPLNSTIALLLRRAGRNDLADRVQRQAAGGYGADPDLEGMVQQALQGGTVSSGSGMQVAPTLPPRPPVGDVFSGPVARPMPAPTSDGGYQPMPLGGASQMERSHRWPQTPGARMDPGGFRPMPMPTPYAPNRDRLYHTTFGPESLSRGRPQPMPEEVQGGFRPMPLGGAPRPGFMPGPVPQPRPMPKAPSQAVSSPRMDYGRPPIGDPEMRERQQPRPLLKAQAPMRRQPLPQKRAPMPGVRY